MNPQTKRHNINLFDRSKYLPMVFCEEIEGTEKVEGRWIRPARDNENANLHKALKAVKESSAQAALEAPDDVKEKF